MPAILIPLAYIWHKEMRAKSWRTSLSDLYMSSKSGISTRKVEHFRDI